MKLGEDLNHNGWDHQGQGADWLPIPLLYHASEWLPFTPIKKKCYTGNSGAVEANNAVMRPSTSQ